MKSKKLLAIGSAMLLVAGFVSLGASPANADNDSNSNEVTYWQNQYPGSTCYKFNLDDSSPYGAVTNDQKAVTLSGSSTWVALIVNGGSGDTVIAPPESGVAYYPPLNNGGQPPTISHWIVCINTTPPPVTTVPAATFTDVCGIANDSYSAPADTASIDYSTTDNRVNGVGTVTVTAAPQSGYTFADGAYTGPWSHTFTDEVCPTEVTTVPVATFTDMCGTANDSYSAPADTDGIHYSVVDSRVDGVGTVTVTAAPQSGYVFADGAYTGPWSHTFTDEVCPIEVVTVPLATFTDACGTANDSYSAPTDTAEIDYTVVDSRVNGVGTVTVTAAPQVGYVFADGAYTGPWSHTFTNADCVVDNFVVPDPTDQSCSVTGDGIPVSGYIWVDLGGNLGNEISYQIVGGTYNYTATQEINNLPPGTYTVTATAKPGFTLDSSKASSWTLTIGSAENCDLITHPLISTTATFKNITCSAGGSYTLAATEGVLWFVNGSSTPTAPGTYHVTSATTVNIQAQTTGPDYGWEQDAQTSWTFDFTTPADCLPTLAFTGSDSAPIGLLLAGGFLLLGGTIIAFERRLRKTAR
ncbi:hypothetical protein BKA04_001415 [Cryobacterium mesophilum]|uniref:LPXTG-motif cell wall anchor domain-containing protein n=1 Tax=Terrimesophilobacter mesophilus TaxID=433647 RepID=A0A4R8V9R7_9MICO|nr:hypothetical protein [Terrimesophilobacter mesophilus]MBB5633192.1 hypothetical protein [Terrimesophilobacter mesophilus]TFB79941.1 hypothetical protein E3N84_07720 [Terrimesophilobacter mesophilus]